LTILFFNGDGSIKVKCNL